MSILDALFARHKTYTADIYKRTAASPVTYGLVKSAICMYWIGQAGKNLVSEQIKQVIEGVIIFKPSDVFVDEIYIDGYIRLRDTQITGAVNNVAGYLAGVATIAVDGFSESLRHVSKGDEFLITGETGAPVHTVIGTVQTLGSTTSLSFTPVTASVLTDDQVITVKPIIGKYSPIYADNIAMQNTVIMVPVKKFNG